VLRFGGAEALNEIDLVLGAVQLGGVVVWLRAWRASRVWTESLNEAGYHAIWLDALEEVRYGWRYWTWSDMAGLWRFEGAVASGIRSGNGGGMARA